MCYFIHFITALNLIGFAIITKNTLYFFKMFIHIAIPKHVTDKYISVHSVVELATSKSTMYFFICKVQRTCLITSFCRSFQHYLLVLDVSSLFTAIKNWLYFMVLEELNKSTTIISIEQKYQYYLNSWPFLQ